jgi:NADPH:quinone reductase-like Zn-dependent oxidoreductase
MRDIDLQQRFFGKGTQHMTHDIHINTTPGEPDVDLAGKKMLVTGGSRGVGTEVARIAARCGADVAINYRSKVRRAE